VIGNLIVRATRASRAGLYLAFRSPEPSRASRPLRGDDPCRTVIEQLHKPIKAVSDFSASRSAPLKATRNAGGQAAGLDRRDRARIRNIVSAPGECRKPMSHRGNDLRKGLPYLRPNASSADCPNNVTNSRPVRHS
jgi:hypothetical protein